jgi:uncharacterized protein
MARIAIFGATGTIGRRILREAVARGHTVTAVVRDPAKADADGCAVVTGDVLDPDAVARAATGQDVLVSAVGAGTGEGNRALIEPAAESLVDALRRLGPGAPRLIAVGGAGSLRTGSGGQVWDAPGLPDAVLDVMHAHGDALDFLRTVRDVRWTTVSPAARIAPGERTGRYRTALDDLVVGPDGGSTISTEDYAVAVLDEIERPQHIGERFTVGY